jgi:hypothetical protein
MYVCMCKRMYVQYGELIPMYPYDITHPRSSGRESVFASLFRVEAQNSIPELT